MNDNHQPWYPDDSVLTSLKDVLQETLILVSEVQKNAQETLGLMQNIPNFHFYLLRVLRDSSCPEDVRSLSGILLKNNLRTAYSTLTPNDASKLKEECQNLLTDASRDVRLSVSKIITIIARDDHLSDWVGILLKLVADQNEFSEVALKTLFEICEDLIVNRSGACVVKQVFLKFIECLISTSYCSMHRDIVRLTNQCLQDHFLIVKQALDMDLYLRQVIGLANTDDIELQKHVCHAFVIYVEQQEESLLPHLHDVIMYIVEKNQHEDAEIALQACEFWMAVSKLASCTDILAPYLDKVVPILLKNMRYSMAELNALKGCLGSDADTEDLAKDVAPFHANIEDDDFDDFHMGWTLRKCSAASLDSLAVQFKNDLLPVIVAFLSEMLNHEDYLVKESGILAVGAIAEGCINGLKHQLHDLMQFLQVSMNDEHSLVRVITCWTISRCAAWIINLRPDAYLVPVMILILKHFMDCNKGVQRAAISAFCVFLDEAQMKLVPYINIIVESFLQGLERFQCRSLYLLYDAIGALAQSVGNYLNEPEYVGKLLPPLMQTLSKINDNYDDHFVILLECLANVIPAVELSFLPYAEIVYCHCLQLINDTLICFGNFHDNPDVYDPPDKEPTSVAHDVLHSMAIGLKAHFVKDVTNSNLLSLLYTTCQDSSCSVRQTSIALYGELVTLCFAYLSSNVHDFVPLIIQNLDERNYGVCNNAAWVVGKLCTAMGPNMQPYVSDIVKHFIRILDDQALARNLHQTLAIALCIVLLVCPDANVPALDVTLKNCCQLIRNVRDSNEKDSAFRGLCEMIVRCPDFSRNYFIFFCDAAASWFNINSDLKDNIRRLIMSFKNECGEGLNITAIAVAIYEWLSPFGLNPWGRQRSKNFSMSSALWVMWGLLCGHLVAFKAPKSWPNKFLINVWGGFSVIFVASYTANIAALIAGLFFQNTVSNYHDRSLLSQKVGAPKSSAAEYYVQRANQLLWQHMSKFSLKNAEEGVERLRNGSLDILIADTPILDYYRATDHGCKLQKIGDTINEDTYAIGMAKGFPLKDSISAVIAKYSSNGYMDILQEKWYGGLPCFKLAQEIAQPRPLGVAAVTGVFILLGMGIVIGLVTLLVEHLFFKYILPILRDKPKESMWRSRNIMFFSQKLYRFINCVELVSPHHAARELVHTIRQGQITSLFQKSIKRKEHEQRRRRKSKAQFFEMIQEIRRQQQQEENQAHLESVTEVDSEYNLSPDEKKTRISPNIIKRTFLRSSPKTDNEGKIKSPTGLFNKQLFSPRSKKAKSSTALNVRRFSTDSVFNSQTLVTERSASIGRRLSKDASTFLSSSPPDINSRRSSYLDIISSGSKLSGKSPILSIENISDCGSTKSAETVRKLSDCESIGKKLATLPKYQGSFDKTRLQPQYSLTLGKSDETLSNREKLQQPAVGSAKSFNSIDKLDQKSNLSGDEIARRNKETISQLQLQIKSKTKKQRSLENNKPAAVVSPNPQIRIQVEDTDSVEKASPPKRNPPLAKTTRSKARHQSLGEPNPNPPIPDHSKRNKLHEPSRSLDSGTASKSRSRSRSRSRHLNEDELPPAPPPPNCSPRNSDGKSPLDRLSRDDLVKLWRSSESELRSHLLKAIRDKEEPSDPT